MPQTLTEPSLEKSPPRRPPAPPRTSYASNPDRGRRRGNWRAFKIFGRPWQDLIFAIGEIVFLASLFPLLFDKNAHVPLFTGLATGFMLYTFVAAHVSYRNWITVGLAAITATLWILIGIGVHI